jgi:PAS domain S-box-containing protein
MTTGIPRDNQRIEGATPADGPFCGAGEMRALCRAFDWSATSLGPVAAWPLTLRTIVATLLASRQPMFLWWGPELVQIYNDAYRPSFGNDGRHPRALGMRGADFWTDIWAIIGPQIAQVMAGGDATWNEDQLVPIERNGRLEDEWWTYSYGPAFDDNGVVAGVLVVCQETTERVLTERRLEATNRALDLERAHLAYAVQHSPAFFAILRGDRYVIEFVNEAYYQLVGHREVLGRPVFDALPEARGQGLEALLDKVVASGEPFVGNEMPILLSRTPGAPPEQRMLDFVYYPLIEADGSHSGVIVHGVDVTNHVAARSELEEVLAESETAKADAEDAREEAEAARAEALQAERQIRTLADAIPTLAWTARADGYIDWYNARWYEYTGTTAEQMEGWGWMSMHDPAGLPEVLERWKSSIATGQRFEMTFPLRGADGQFRPFLTRIVPVHDADGRVLRWFGTNTDVEVEQRLRKEAESANRAKSDFLAIMSHELRTPLNAIGGYAQLIEMGIHGPVTAEQRQALERLQRSQRHLLGLINGVLNFAKVDAGAVRYEVGVVRMGDMFATCEALTAPQMSEKHLAFQSALCENASACADAEKVQQILLNLLSNAISFTEPSGRITMECSIEGKFVHVRVRDTGHGISSDQLERVFQPFVQIDVRLTRTKEGTGLGLAISRDLARGMGGDLVAESEIGVGSTFILTLPIAD